MLLNEAHLKVLESKITEEHLLIRDIIVKGWSEADDIYELKYNILYKMMLWEIIPAISWVTLTKFKELQ